MNLNDLKKELVNKKNKKTNITKPKKALKQYKSLKEKLYDKHCDKCINKEHGKDYCILKRKKLYEKEMTAFICSSYLNVG